MTGLPSITAFSLAVAIGIGWIVFALGYVWGFLDGEAAERKRLEYRDKR